MYDPRRAGIPKHPARIQMEHAITIVMRVARFPLCEWNFLSGSTIAKNRSPLRAVSVNTETPIDRSLKNSEMMHSGSPHGHELWMYITLVSGTVVKITIKSPRAKERMYLCCWKEKVSHLLNIFLSEIFLSTHKMYRNDGIYNSSRYGFIKYCVCMNIPSYPHAQHIQYR